jgi:hypothetical protein
MGKSRNDILHREIGIRVALGAERLLRPDDSLTILKMALSVGFIRFVSSTDATQVTGL